MRMTVQNHSGSKVIVIVTVADLVHRLACFVKRKTFAYDPGLHFGRPQVPASNIDDCQKLDAAFSSHLGMTCCLD